MSAWLMTATESESLIRLIKPVAPEEGAERHDHDSGLGDGLVDLEELEGVPQDGRHLVTLADSHPEQGRWRVD